MQSYRCRLRSERLLVAEDIKELKEMQIKATYFIEKILKLEINSKNTAIIKPGWGLNFLGVEIFPNGRRLNKRNWYRAKTLVNANNFSSYHGLVTGNSKAKIIKEFQMTLMGI